jgi:hypothetical protein
VYLLCCLVVKDCCGATEMCRSCVVLPQAYQLPADLLTGVHPPQLQLEWLVPVPLSGS